MRLLQIADLPVFLSASFKVFHVSLFSSALRLSPFSPEETDKAMAVALDSYTCEVVIKRLNVSGASGSC